MGGNLFTANGSGTAAVVPCPLDIVLVRKRSGFRRSHTHSSLNYEVHLYSHLWEAFVHLPRQLGRDREKVRVLSGFRKVSKTISSS